jgi:hypothetical protein
VPSARHSFAATSTPTVPSSRPAFAISGGTNSKHVLRDTWLLELELADGHLHAERREDMPAARMGHTLSSINGIAPDNSSSLMLVGGAAGLFGEDAQQHVWLFDFVRDKWRPAVSLPEPRAFHSAVVHLDSVFVWAGSASVVRHSGRNVGSFDCCLMVREQSAQMHGVVPCVV